MSEPAPPAPPAPTLFLSDADVGELSDWRAAVAALADAYAAEVHPAMVPPRGMARGDGIWLRSLSAVSPGGGTMGCKLIAASPRARRASYLVALFDQHSMALAALIDGNRLTGLRTAATAALAVDRLAPARPLQVGVIWSGFEARGALECLAAVRTLRSVRVFSPTPASRERFAQGFRPALDISAVDDAAAAVQGADVVLCAARSRDETPVLRGAWLPGGATVVSLGSTLPEQREIDEDTMARAACIVADMPDEVARDTGDAIAAANRSPRRPRPPGPAQPGRWHAAGRTAPLPRARDPPRDRSRPRRLRAVEAPDGQGTRPGPAPLVRAGAAAPGRPGDADHVERIVERVAKLRVGSGLEPGVHIGR